MSIQGLTNTCAKPNPKIFNYTSICKSNFNGICRIKFRVCAKTKGFEAKFANPKSSTGTHDKFSAPVKPIGPMTPSSSPKQSEEDEEKQNYHLNMGYAIRSLREEFPELFDRDLSFDIYRFRFVLSLMVWRNSCCLLHVQFRWKIGVFFVFVW